jgi:hypothetical protein
VQQRLLAAEVERLNQINAQTVTPPPNKAESGETRYPADWQS